MFLSSGGPVLSISSGQIHSDDLPNSPSAASGSAEVVPGSPTSFTAVASSPVVFIGTIPSSSSTVLVVGANEVVSQSAMSSLTVSEAEDPKPPTSPPSPDSGAAGGPDDAQEEVRPSE